MREGGREVRREGELLESFLSTQPPRNKAPSSPYTPISLSAPLSLPHVSAGDKVVLEGELHEVQAGSAWLCFANRHLRQARGRKGIERELAGCEINEKRNGRGWLSATGRVLSRSFCTSLSPLYFPPSLPPSPSLPPGKRAARRPPPRI